MNAGMTPSIDGAEVLRSTASRIQECITAAQVELAAVSTEAQSLLTGDPAQGKRPGRGDLAPLREQLQEYLRGPEPSMEGVGVAMAVDFLGDSPYWLEWWRRTRGEELEFVAHSLNPHRDAFYDYSSRPWFTVPAASGRATVTGPYVDVGGTNAYTVTVSLPILVGGIFAGVAGADIPASRFERFLVGPGGPSLPVVLVNAGLRIIASNRADYLPGDLVAGNAARSWPHVPVLPGTSGQDPWLLLLPESTGVV